ncbi:lipopolysaccharide biosynthesis protein [Streptococcus ruminicola]|uniref:lipopolysaccharide biosynthesis protein n=1 Tax=Streptococcus ruminicola TaxID=2686210 RepID=UPI003F60420D
MNSTVIINQKQNFIWNMIGSVSSALISVFLLMIVSRFLSTSDSDVYAYAYSIGNLLVVIGLFQVRNFQATDIGEKYSFSNYFLARFLTSVLMIIAIILFLLFMNFDKNKSQVIFFVTIYRLSDAISDLFQGLFQQRERLDIAGKSLTYRNLLIFFIFTLSVHLTGDLLCSLKFVCIISYAFILFFDMRISHSFEKIIVTEIFQKNEFLKVIQLLKESFPLFLNGFLIIYIYNQPKYSLDFLGSVGKIQVGAQTIFNILFMPAFVMNLMMLFFRPLITEMAVDILHNQLSHFKKLQKTLFGYLGALSILVILGSGLFGISILEILYGEDLQNYWLTLLIIMIGGAVGSFATAIDNILTAMRRQKYLLIPYGGAFIVSQIITNTLVENLEILGASLSFLITMNVWLLISIFIFQVLKYKKRIN